MGKKPYKTRRIHADCSCTNVRMKSDVPLRLRFVLSKLWKPNKTRSCGKEAIQNQDRIKFRVKSHVPLRFGFVLSELWKPNKTRSCGKEANKPGENPCKLFKSKNKIRCSAPLRVVEAKQNQELWERSQTKPRESMQHKSENEIRCSAPLRIYLANYKLSKTS